MRTQLKGGTMKKKTQKKFDGGKLMSMLSPAYALNKSLKSGKAEGILGMGALGALYNATRKKKKGDVETSEMDDRPKSNMAAKSSAAKPMKKGGRVRGDGICQRGKTKGRMR
jgi:hypothetical protein